MKNSFCIFVLMAFSPMLRAQTSAEGSEDPIDRMKGNWKVEGQIMGRDVHHEIQAEWVLNHQFLRIHEKTAPGAPAAEQRYEATWFIGYDSVSERYVLHYLDVFGPRFAQTLGYGVRDGDAFRFVFEYPDGPFHAIYRWSREKDTWHWEMRQKEKNGKWANFADLNLTRIPK